MDISDFIKNNFIELYKQKPPVSGPEAVLKRINQMNQTRRNTRLNEICQKRNIPSDFSPITPGIERKRGEVLLKYNAVDCKRRQRLEQLVKWKVERQKQKLAQKKVAKPVFKVSNVKHELGLPNLDNVNFEIKGKSFKKNFAPRNYKFKPPPNIKPIFFNKEATKEERERQVGPRRIVTRSQTRTLEIEAKEKQSTIVKSADKTKDIIKEEVIVETPRKDAPPPYISPFVTLSRGKSNAREEYEMRRTGRTKGKEDELDCTSSKAGAEYFNWILNKEISRLKSLSEDWFKYQTEKDLPEEATSMIDVAIGQANLFFSNKCEQFRCLIAQCKHNDHNEVVTCEDLHGFWELMRIQVNDLDKRFENLKNLEGSNWKEILPVIIKKAPVKKENPTRNIKASSLLKETILAARRKKQLKSVNESVELKAKTPKRNRNFDVVKSVRNDSQRISSPGLTIISVSQYAKNVETPSKSILKTDAGMSSVKSLNKSVLFKHVLEDKENFIDIDKENTKMPLQPETSSRRSLRLSTRTKLF